LELSRFFVNGIIASINEEKITVTKLIGNLISLAPKIAMEKYGNTATKGSM